MEYRKKTLSGAKKVQQQMKRQYGYKPTIFRERNPNTHTQRYVVVKPTGLRKTR